MKGGAAAEICNTFLESPLNRSAGQRLFRSALNFGLMVAADEARGIKAGDPQAINKLFEGSQRTGGASAYEMVMLGAQSWMQHDETYQLTGRRARVCTRTERAVMPQ